MTVPPERRVEGQLFGVGGGLFVARYPLSTALPIPLALHGANLLTWAFAGLGQVGADPVSLVVFTADAPPETLAVETHFHDIVVMSPPVRPAADLDPAERAALCPALLGALTPATLASLAGLLPLLGPALSTLADSRENSGRAVPRLVLTGETAATLTGTHVPDYLMLRSGVSWRCLHVARARLTFGAEPRAILDLVPARGEPAGDRCEAALLVWPGEIAAARVEP